MANLKENAQWITLAYAHAGGASAVALAADRKRRGLVIQAPTGVNIRIAFGSTLASATVGILLLGDAAWDFIKIPPDNAVNIYAGVACTINIAYAN
jgi:hypothetical protein